MVKGSNLAALMQRALRHSSINLPNKRPLNAKTWVLSEKNSTHPFKGSIAFKARNFQLKNNDLAVAHKSNQLFIKTDRPIISSMFSISLKPQMVLTKFEVEEPSLSMTVEKPFGGLLGTLSRPV